MRLSRSVLALACMCSFALPALAADATPVEFVAIGDVPYDVPADNAGFERLIAAINASRPAFTVHVGDFKKGSKPCSDEIAERVHGYFNTFEQPLIYTPGDNEWTDCHRAGSDPLERLAKLRKLFFSGPASQGRQKLPVIRQSQTKGFEKFVENARWSRPGLEFATFHAVGSNNNLLFDKREAFDEYLARNAANVAWIDETFALAKARGAKGVVFFTQADPFFEKWESERSGFNAQIGALEAGVASFPGQTLLVHGDTHVFKVDKPLHEDDGREQMRFTRAEVFAEKNLHAVRIKADPTDPDVFTFKVMIVQENLTPDGISRK